MAQDWLELTKLTGGAPIVVERVRLAGQAIHIEGEFELPPLARLSTEDQVFVMAFLRSDGSIKELERSFGISYPTVKSRLARIAAQFEFVETSYVKSRPAAAPAPPAPPAPPPLTLTPVEKSEILDRLERGEVTPAEAIRRLTQ
jgi:hypothetical protein